jgi:D-alanine transaminase
MSGAPAGARLMTLPADSLPLANVDGQLLPLAEVRVSALDRGFLFGDAVYEVLRVYGGKPWLADEHFTRLARSLEAIRLAGVDLGRLRRRMAETMAAAGCAEALVYIQVTRGAAPRSHPFPKDARPYELLWVQPFADSYGEQRRVGGAVLSQPDVRWDRCDIKSTNLLGNVLAMQAAKEAGCVEAALYLPDGSYTELFGVVGGTRRTAPLGGILAGTTRGLVLDLARQQGVAVEESPLNCNRTGEIDELFLSGTTAEVLPVVRLDGKPVGDGKPGPVTRRLQDAYARAVEAFRAGA